VFTESGLEKKVDSDQLCFPNKQKSLRNIIAVCCLLTKVFVLNDLLLGEATEVFPSTVWRFADIVFLFFRWGSSYGL